MGKWVDTAGIGQDVERLAGDLRGRPTRVECTLHEQSGRLAGLESAVVRMRKGALAMAFRQRGDGA